MLTRMTRTTAWLAALAAGVVIAQEPVRSGTGGQDQPKQEQGSQDAAASADKWIAQLGAEKYEKREAAARALRELGAAATEALREAAGTHADLDVRLRARKLLEAITSADEVAPEAGAERLRRRVDPPVAPSPLDPGADRAPQPLEEFERLFRGMGPGIDDLRRQMDEMRRMLDSGLVMPLPGIGQGGPEQGSGTSLSITPDGVRLEVTELDADGERQTEVYEAPDLETLRREHPELADRLPSVGGLGRLQRPGRLVPWNDGGWAPLAPFGGAVQPADPPGPGEVLGVRAELLDPAVADYLSLEPGLGLLVRVVEDDSLAAAAGIEDRDVILAIVGRPIRAVSDVRAALGGLAAGQQVTVVVNRFGRRVELETTKQVDGPGAQKQSDATDPTDGDDAGRGGLRRRRD